MVKNAEMTEFLAREYPYGFVTEVASFAAQKGLSEDTIRFISAEKNEPDWLLSFRLKAYRHWLEFEEPIW